MAQNEILIKWKNKKRMWKEWEEKREEKRKKTVRGILQIKIKSGRGRNPTFA